MTNTFLFALVGVLIFPLVPAFLLFKFLPSASSVDGPFKGLSIKLTGAFGGYFLLVIVASAIFFPILKNEQQQRIEELERQLASAKPLPSESWKIFGHVVSSIPEQTKVFFDDEMPAFPPTGDFELTKKCILEDGKAKIPKWICIYNKTDGYKVINLNRALSSPDIQKFKISFNDSTHQIAINQPIDIMSKKNDSLQYVGTFLVENPALTQNISSQQAHVIRPELLQAAVAANPHLGTKAEAVQQNLRPLIRTGDAQHPLRFAQPLER